MTDFENAYVGMGTSPHLDFDFKAIAGDKKTWSATWGFVTKNWMSDLVMFKIGGSFGGFYYGVQGYGGDPDDKGNSGPQVNEYSDFAGVFGTACMSPASRVRPSTIAASTASMGRTQTRGFPRKCRPVFSARRRNWSRASLGGRRRG